MALGNESMNVTAIDDISVPVGIAYITIGAFFIVLHIVCAYIMYTDKEMKNPTYELMISLGIIDCITLSCIGIYAGAVLVSGIQYESIDRMFSLVQALAWYASCVVLVAVAFSRWVSISRPHLLATFFRRKVMWSIHIVPWVALGAFYFYPVVFRREFLFMPQWLTWGFATTTTYGEYLHWHNFVFSSGCAVIETTFNILSFIRVHKMRKTISESISTQKNHRREIKLLIQCFIIGCVFALTEILFTVANAAHFSTQRQFLFMQLVWLSNHCINPVVYLTMNTKLRNRFIGLMTFGRWEKTSKKIEPANTASRG